MADATPANDKEEFHRALYRRYKDYNGSVWEYFDADDKPLGVIFKPRRADKDGLSFSLRAGVRELIKKDHEFVGTIIVENIRAVRDELGLSDTDLDGVRTGSKKRPHHCSVVTYDVLNRVDVQDELVKHLNIELASDFLAHDD